MYDVNERRQGAWRYQALSSIGNYKSQSVQYRSNQYTVHLEQNMATDPVPGRLRVLCRKRLL